VGPLASGFEKVSGAGSTMDACRIWHGPGCVRIVHRMDASDPLIPPPDDVWLAVPAVGPDEDPERAMAEAVSDYFNFNAIAWPARDASGAFVAPPDEHVLDRLARAEELVSEEQSQVRPEAGTVTVMSTLPPCNLCGLPARYDAKLTVDETEAFGFACPDCYGRHGSGTLGATGAVYMMMWDEVSPEVRAVCDELTASLGRPSLWT
jgi:hypothetical protein